ncbi:MAG: TetR/AcrR family transcriptional regulator [Bacteroidales bacterium]|jgi:AcrR family transcriptional regulator
MLDTENKILKKSSELFFQHGLRSVSIDEICSNLRISKKTFYKYFNRKDVLIEKILINIEQSKKKYFDELINKEDNNAIDILFEFFSKYKGMHKDKFTNFARDLDKFYPHLSKENDNRIIIILTDFFTSILQKGIEENLFREEIDIEITAQMLSSHITSLIKFSSKSKVPINKISSYYCDFIVRAIATDTGLDYYLNNKDKR